MCQQTEKIKSFLKNRLNTRKRDWILWTLSALLFWGNIIWIFLDGVAVGYTLSLQMVSQTAENSSELQKAIIRTTAGSKQTQLVYDYWKTRSRIKF